MIFYLRRAVLCALLCACIPSLLLTAQDDLANTTATPARGTVSVGMQYLLGDGMTPPTVKPNSPSIAYPELALVQGIEGHVEVKILVDKVGSVAEVSVVSSSDPIFVDQTVEGIRKFKFVPASVDGVATELWLRMDIGFKAQHSWTDAFEADGEGASGTWAVVGDSEGPQMDEEKFRQNLVFPKEALDRGAGGTVVIRTKVSSEGEVVAMEVEGTADGELAAAAFEAIAQTPFSPGIEEGKPAEMWTMIPVTFSNSNGVGVVTAARTEEATKSPEITTPTYDIRELYGNFHYKGPLLTEGVDVKLRVLIDESGSVEQVMISDETNAHVSKAAAEAVTKTSFTPGVQKGDPIPVWITVEMRVSPKAE